MHIVKLNSLIISLLLVISYFIPVSQLTFFVNKDKKLSLIFSIVFLLINLSFFDSKYYLFLIPIIIFIYLLIIFRNISISLILTCFIWILLLFAEEIADIVLISVLKCNTTYIYGSSKIYIALNVLIVICSYIFSKIFKTILLKIFNKLNIDLCLIKELRISVMFTVIMFFFTIYQTVISRYARSWYDFIFLSHIINSLVFFTFVMILLYCYLNTLINKYKYNEYSKLKNYTSILENNSADLRTFKHDYINILSTLSEYIDNENIKDLKTYYYNEIMPESIKIVDRNLSISLLSHIKLNPLKSILAYKISSACSKNINVKLELPEDIDFININIIDICKIIGIFMDNAIESSILCDNKFIHFAAIKTDDNVIFNISNSCPASTPPVHKIYEHSFSTKGTGRGLGLSTVKEIINKNYENVLLNTTIKNCIFTQKLVIYNK